MPALLAVVGVCPTLSGMERRKRLSEVSRELGIGVKALRAAIRRGDLRAVKPGRSESAWLYVTDNDVNEWLQAHPAKGGQPW